MSGPGNRNVADPPGFSVGAVEQRADLPLVGDVHHPIDAFTFDLMDRGNPKWRSVRSRRQVERCDEWLGEETALGELVPDVVRGGQAKLLLQPAQKPLDPRHKQGMPLSIRNERPIRNPDLWVSCKGPQ